MVEVSLHSVLSVNSASVVISIRLAIEFDSAVFFSILLYVTTRQQEG